MKILLILTFFLMILLIVLINFFIKNKKQKINYRIIIIQIYININNTEFRILQNLDFRLSIY